MNPPILYLAIGSSVVGLLFILFAKKIGIVINWHGRSLRKRHENDLFGSIRREFKKAFPKFVPEYDDDAKTSRTFRFLGLVFIFQGIVLLLLSKIL